MTYSETLDWLWAHLPMYQEKGNSAFRPKLDNILMLCEHLGSPQEQFPSVHIAGTNGKGSSSHAIASVLQEAGYKVGISYSILFVIVIFLSTISSIIVVPGMSILFSICFSPLCVFCIFVDF